MKGEICNLIALNTLPLIKYDMMNVKGKSKSIEVIFCAVGNGMIDTSYIKPQKSLVRMLFLCWEYIKRSSNKRTGN